MRPLIAESWLRSRELQELQLQQNCSTNRCQCGGVMVARYSAILRGTKANRVEINNNSNNGHYTIVACIKQYIYYSSIVCVAKTITFNEEPL